MGSFTPFASWLCACVCAWGMLTSVLIDCLSYLDESCILNGSGDGHQIRRFGSLAPGFFRFFAHVRNLDALQHRFNPLVHLAKRFADIATVGLVALPAHRYTGSDEQRPIDGLNHLEGCKQIGRAHV